MLPSVISKLLVNKQGLSLNLLFSLIWKVAECFVFFITLHCNFWQCLSHFAWAPAQHCSIQDWLKCLWEEEKEQFCWILSNFYVWSIVTFDSCIMLNLFVLVMLQACYWENRSNWIRGFRVCEPIINVTGRLCLTRRPWPPLRRRPGWYCWCIQVSRAD